MSSYKFSFNKEISFVSFFRNFIVSLATERTLRVFKIHKEKKEGASSSITISPEFDFPKVHKDNIICAAISSNGKYIMSADCKTQIVIWNFKGLSYN